MFSERYYESQIDKLIHSYTLKILNDQIESKYQTGSILNDRLGNLGMTILTLTAAAFNGFLCLLLIGHAVTWLSIV